MSYLPGGHLFFLLLTACVTLADDMGKLYMFKQMEMEPYKSLYRGYPRDTIGRIFFPFSVEELTCTFREEFSASTSACKRAFMSTHGISTAYHDGEPRDLGIHAAKPYDSWYDRDQLNLNYLKVPLYNSPDLKGIPSSGGDAFRRPGVLSGERVRRIQEIMHKCAERIGRRRHPGDLVELGCGYADFLDLMFRGLESKGRNILAPLEAEEAFSAMFWYYYCKIAWPEAVKWNPSRIRMYAHPSCPKPCANITHPCTRKSNVVRLGPSILMDPEVREETIFNESFKICQMTESGVYAHNYRCVCQRGYEWSTVMNECLLIDGCRDPKTGQHMCSRNGTQRCISMSANLAREDQDLPTAALSLPYACICYPGYMGYRCESRRDACIEHSSRTAMAGNQACRTYLGNTCNPHIGTDLYSCTCTKDWQHDKDADFPNCFKRKSICDRIICRRGTCFASRDEHSFICVCQMGWHGRLCDQPDIRTWLPWESWGRCSAEVCTGIGWRTRVRRCRTNVTELADKGLCAGNDRDRQLCKAPCLDAMDAYAYLVKTLLLLSAVCKVLMSASFVVYLRVSQCNGFLRILGEDTALGVCGLRGLNDRPIRTLSASTNRTAVI